MKYAKIARLRNARLRNARLRNARLGLASDDAFGMLCATYPGVDPWRFAMLFAMLAIANEEFEGEVPDLVCSQLLVCSQVP